VATVPDAIQIATDYAHVSALRQNNTVSCFFVQGTPHEWCLGAMLGGSDDSGEFGQGHAYLNLLPRELSPVEAGLTPHYLVKAQCTIDLRNKLLPREIPRSVASLAV
jgi:hypothetical protein